MALAFLPLCLVVTVGVWFVVLDARAVHHGLQRMFEELREVALTRTLQDELRGLQQWVEAVPEAKAATHPLVVADLRQHHDAARATFARFAIADDPSNAAHTAEEHGLLARIGQNLDTLQALLATEQPIADLREPLAIALHSATVLAHAVSGESREIGDELDQRSEGMAEFMMLLGLASVATMAGLGVLLLRRVLVPVRELREGAAAFGDGQLSVQVPVRHADELGELAETFMAMAGQMQRSREELEQRVEQRSREVLRTARLAELGSLAAGIAHEINNPLASIAACAEGLLREGGDHRPEDAERLRNYLQIIRKEAMRTRDITSRLLRFSRQEPGRRERVRLGNELREVAPMFAHQLADAGVQLQFDADQDGPVVVGDAAEWRQVLFNLLRNALDASPRQGVVSVRCSQSAGEVRIEVQDDGPGIPDADLDRIFEPFFTTKEPGKGTGLGLAIVHRIVTAHGGAVAVENRRPHGACFRITVPAADAGRQASAG